MGEKFELLRGTWLALSHKFFYYKYYIIGLKGLFASFLDVLFEREMLIWSKIILKAKDLKCFQGQESGTDGENKEWV